MLLFLAGLAVVLWADETDARLLESPGFREMPGFSTDFSRSLIPAEEVISGGPAKDGIPAIDDPGFVSVDDASEWLDSDELVFAVEVSGAVHIYPVQILMWHEIVNDTVGRTPVTVTYCPLCNTGLAFARELEYGGRSRTLDFGTTGRLRFSNLLMYDRQTESWWQQATGEALVGELAGATLQRLPMLALPWRTAAERYPQAQVLSRRTGYSRPYGSNPYNGYDGSPRPFLYDGPETPGGLSPMTRVLHVDVAGESAVYPYTLLRNKRLIQDEIAGVPIVVIWQPGTASALDATSVASGRDVGSANAFRRVLDGRTLEFAFRDGRITDTDTGSSWDVAGVAVQGPRAGSRLQPIVSIQHFYFSWAAFERR